MTILLLTTDKVVEARRGGGTGRGTGSSTTKSYSRYSESYYDAETGYGRQGNGKFKYAYGTHVSIYTYYYEPNSGVYYYTDNVTGKDYKYNPYIKFYIITFAISCAIS